MDDPVAPDGEWWLYLLHCAAGRTYVGITTDLERRLAQHNGEQPGGAKSTRVGRPWAVAKHWGPFDRSEATRLELRLKGRRAGKRLEWEP